MARKQWPIEVHGVQTILDEGLEVKDMSVKDLLIEILLELKKLNLHAQIITDEEIENDDNT